MPAPTMRFTWDRGQLSLREDMLVHAVIELFLMNSVLRKRVERGGPAPTRDEAAEEGAEAIRATLAWAQLRFPDLNVRYE